MCITGFYDRVWFKEDAGLGETKLGRFLGVSHHIGSLMSYWVLPVSGIPISRTTVQRVTNLESATNQNQKRFEVYDKRIADRFNEEYIGENYLQNHHQKPDVELWEGSLSRKDNSPCMLIIINVSISHLLFLHGT